MRSVIRPTFAREFFRGSLAARERVSLGLGFALGRARLSPRRLAPRSAHPLTIGLLAAIVLLLGANVALGVYELLRDSDANGVLVDLFHLDVERNVPTAFAAGQLMLASLLLFGIARREARAGSRQSWYWLALGVGFAYLAIDEAVLIHEQAFPRLIGDPTLGGPFRHVWVIPAMGIVAVVGVAFVPFLLRLPASTRALLIVAGALYVMSAIGGEMLGALTFSRLGQSALTGALVTLEEGGELLGVLLLIHALLAFRATRSARADQPRGDTGHSLLAAAAPPAVGSQTGG
ncbi:MAG: hypothetical protein O3C25_00430 [Chloroflexi bacterium]|nr:hypothetical protein [Chloroflexota bacterium]